MTMLMLLVTDVRANNISSFSAQGTTAEIKNKINAHELLKIRSSHDHYNNVAYDIIKHFKTSARRLHQTKKNEVKTVHHRRYYIQCQKIILMHWLIQC